MKGFVNQDIIIAQSLAWPRERVFRAMTAEIGSWWEHRFRKGSSVGFEPRIGGRFYEDFGAGSAALYAFVTFIDPPARLRLEGPMGIDGAIVSVMNFDFEAVGEGTKLTLVHSLIGTIEAGTVTDYEEGWKLILGTKLPGFLGA